MLPLWFLDSWVEAGGLGTRGLSYTGVSNTKGKRPKCVPFPYYSENRWWQTQEKHRRVPISSFQCTVKTVPKDAAASPCDRLDSRICFKAVTPHWYPPGNREDGRMEASVSAFVSCLPPMLWARHMLDSPRENLSWLPSSSFKAEG